MCVDRLVMMVAVLAPTVAQAQSAFGTPDGTRVPGAVIECATNSPTLAAPCGVTGAPLKIDQGSANALPPAGGSGVIGFLAGIYSSITAGITVGGSVSVANLPATQPVSGAVSVSNLPSVQQVGGTVASNDGGSAITGTALPAGGVGLTGWLSAIWSKLAGTLNVSVNNYPVTQQITGSVSVSNLPASQVVSGLVATSDTGTAIRAATMPSGGQGITGWLSAIWSELSGTLTVSVANLPLTQPVSGSVTVGNFPVSQTVNGSVTAMPPSATVTDCSLSLVVAGASYQLITAGISRKSVLIQNLGSTSAGFSLTTSSPAIGALGTFTLLPNASVQLAPGMSTAGALYAVGSAASQPLACTLFQ